MTDRRKWGSVWMPILAVVFVALRLVDLGSVYLWIDDVHSLTYTDLQPTPWGDLLSESFQHSLDTTGPFFPTLVLKTIHNVTGPRALALRFPAAVVGLLSFLMLYRVLARLFDDRSARGLPLFLFALSVPSIMYSQAMQPSIYYFLSSAIQLYMFIGMAADLKPYTSTRDIFRELQRFALVSTLVFFLNFMSALIYGLLVGSYMILIALKGRGRSGGGRKMTITIFNALVVTIPLLILAGLRARAGTESARPYFEGVYYLDSWKTIVQIPRLTYDLLSYHFNFAYDPDLYMPRGNNWLSLPFVLLVIGGAASWVYRQRAQAAVPLVWAAAVILGAGVLKVMPFGGLRHSFTLAPFLYVAAGYGIAAVGAARWQYVLSGLVAGLALAIFVGSGVHLYADRQSTLKIDTVHELSEQYQTQRVVGYCEAYLILGIWQESDGGADDLDLAEVCEGDEAPDGTPYLLVDYRRTFNPDPTWPALAWNPVISRTMFAGARITPLIEKVGPLDPHHMGVQSIYYPMNGFFVYLVEPEK